MFPFMKFMFRKLHANTFSVIIKKNYEGGEWGGGRLLLNTPTERSNPRGGWSYYSDTSAPVVKYRGRGWRRANNGHQFTNPGFELATFQLPTQRTCRLSYHDPGKKQKTKYKKNAHASYSPKAK
jgi:hypothetical protein